MITSERRKEMADWMAKQPRPAETNAEAARRKGWVEPEEVDAPVTVRKD